MILKYYGHKILIKHCNTAKEPNNLASAVNVILGENAQSWLYDMR